jgi:antitoxin component of MazEF toxin-antitoxin module
MPYRRSKRTISEQRGIGVGLRKIMKLGDSAGLCLPKEFLTSKGLRIGDDVIVAWNGGLKIFPLKTREAGEEGER